MFLWYLFCFALLIKIVFKLTNGICRSNTCLIGKTALITGGNSGIGYETALGLAARGCRVIIASRTSNDQVCGKISKETGNQNIAAKHLDLGSLRSIRKFAEEFIANEDRLDILINNSGVVGLGNSFTEDGIHAAMQINHFGPFLLTYLLLPLIKKSSPARIIFTSSMLAFTHNLTDIKKLNEPYGDRNSDKRSLWTDLAIYSNSKLCNIITARYFAAKLRNFGVTSNALHPGVVHTPIYGLAITRYWPKFCSTLFYTIPGLILKDGFEGAQTTLHLALSDKVNDVTGKYFWDCMPFFKPSLVYDSDMCSRVIEESIRLTKLTADEVL